jgi:hypothetical protein
MKYLAFGLLLSSVFAVSGRDCQLHDPPKKGGFELV